MAETLTSFLTNVGSFVTSAFGWVGTVADTIMEQPALFVMALCMPIAGVAIGYWNRLVRG